MRSLTSKLWEVVLLAVIFLVIVNVAATAIARYIPTVGAVLASLLIAAVIWIVVRLILSRRRHF